MGTIWIKDFRAGLDTRRLPETTSAGATLRMFDCHINRGGEVEQRAVFTKVYESPAGKSVGLGGVPDVGLFIFGNTSGDPAGMPPYMIYRRVGEVDFGGTLGYMRSFDVYNNLPTVVLQYADNSRYAFFNFTKTGAAAPPTLANSGAPSAVFTFAEKLHVMAKSAVHFSGIRTPLLFAGESGVGAGAGFIDFSFNVGGKREIRGAAPWDDGVAFFTPESIINWSIDADPSNNQFRGVLHGTGTDSGMSILPFGNDLFYVHRTGIRSLRAQDSSRALYSMDIGSPIDKVVQDQYFAATAQQKLTASAVIEPWSGNAWFALGDEIYVLSYHPLAKITAWSIYRPGFNVDHMAVHNQRVFLRSGDDIYVYGSVTGAYVYSDAVEAEVWTAYLDGGRPMQRKQGMGVDVSVRGAWEVSVGYDPMTTATKDVIASSVNRSTYGDERIPFEGAFTHASFRFRSLTKLGVNAPAILSSAAVHHNLDDLED